MKTKSIILVFIFLLPQIIFANGLKGFCFKATTSLNQVLSEIRSISLPKDKFFKRESINCIEGKLSNSRFNLFKTILGKKFLLVRTYSGANSDTQQVYSKIRNCKIEIQKTVTSKGKSNRVGLNNGLKISEGRNSGSRTTTSRMLMAEGRESSIGVNDSLVYVSCWPNDVSARINISLSSGNSNLSTSITTRKGKKVNLGQIVDSLKNKNRDISLKNGVQYNKVNSTTISDYFLIYR
jgi:hypothetical protein